MENMNHVRATFDGAAGGYDEQRRKLIPCFDDFYGTAVSLAETRESRPRILDLGAGTGLLVLPASAEASGSAAHADRSVG